MATALYPPIIASSMPAFNVDLPVRIYFTLSNYNSLRSGDIKQVHVSVRHQNSNASVVKNASQILIKDFDIVQNYELTTKRYYIQINAQECLLEVGTLYKVQLRFSSLGFGSNIPIGMDIDKYKAIFLNDPTNQSSFSEWSTVCIIKPIYIPLFSIYLFMSTDQDNQLIDLETGTEEDDSLVANVNYFTYPLPEFTGIYKPKNSNEILKRWRARLLKSSYTTDKLPSSYTLADTDWKMVSVYHYDRKDDILYLDCNLSYPLQANVNYKLLFEILTKNGYIGSKIYLFKYFPQAISKAPGRLYTSVNEEEGYIKLTFKSSKSITSNMCIRRSDSRSDFMIWEDLKNFEAKRLNGFEYYDFTAESGVAYRYFVQKRDARGRRGSPLYDELAIQGRATMGEWEHPFLLLSNMDGQILFTKQLKLKFDFQISSWKTNVSESKTETLGSKYPYVRRNGNMGYKSFPFTGTITAFMDNVDLFASQELIDDDNISIYNDFREEEGYYSRQYDYTYERKFREKVEEFLCNAKPKLYKSMQEGNLLVKIMLVSLTPKNELGRLVYTFSATAYEIDLANITNYNKHGIIDVGTYSPQIKDTMEVFGQLNSYNVSLDTNTNYFKAGLDILGTATFTIPEAAPYNSLARKYHYQLSIDGQKVTAINLNWIRIDIESLPYLIAYKNGQYIPVDDITPYVNPTDNMLVPLYQIGTEYNNTLYYTRAQEGQPMYFGTLLKINGQDIIVAYPHTTYLLMDDNLDIRSIIPAKDLAATIDYRASVSIEEDMAKVPRYIEVSPLIGQLVNTWRPDDEILANIAYKYFRLAFQNDDGNWVNQYLSGLRDVTIDTEPGAVVQTRTSEDETLERIVVNETGILHLNPQDALVLVEKIFITGINIPYTYLHKNRTVDLRTHGLEDISHPVEYDYCTYEGYDYVFFKGTWKPAQKQDMLGSLFSYDIECLVDALIFYEGVLRRDIYDEPLT